jgi:hypothetical protein
MRHRKRVRLAHQASLAWPSTTGRIVKSDVDWVGETGSTSVARVMYQYAVNGTTYQCRRLYTAPDVPFEPAQSIVDRYPVGATVTVFYDPANPAEATLER